MISDIPLVSVLMPVKNEERYLEAALDSLYRQSFTAWELVVVDDGSDDATPRILANAARSDQRIRPITTGGGLVEALNTGLAACRAPLLARMDGDDICHPLRLETQRNFLEQHPDITLVASGFKHFPRTTLKQGMLSYEIWQNALTDHAAIMRDLFVESPFVHPSVMMRRHAVTDLGGYRDCGWPEDYDLWLRLASAGAHFARIPETLFFWRDHPERATRTMTEYSLNAFRSCKCAHLCKGFLAGTDSVAIAGAGSEGRAWHRVLSQHGIRVSAWIDVDPRKIGRQLHGAAIYPMADVLRVSSRKILVAIGVRGAREEFRVAAGNSGLTEGKNFICVC